MAVSPTGHAARRHVHPARMLPPPPPLPPLPSPPPCLPPSLSASPSPFLLPSPPSIPPSFSARVSVCSRSLSNADTCEECNPGFFTDSTNLPTCKPCQPGEPHLMRPWPPNHARRTHSPTYTGKRRHARKQSDTHAHPCARAQAHALVLALTAVKTAHREATACRVLPGVSRTVVLPHVQRLPRQERVPRPRQRVDLQRVYAAHRYHVAWDTV